ncbi:MAG: MazG family protein [Chloroflexota bacterium]
MNTITNLDQLLQAVNFDITQGIQILDAQTVASQHYPQWDINIPVLLLNYTTPIASLNLAYPTTHDVTLISLPDPSSTLALSSLTNHTITPHAPTHLHIPPVEEYGSFSALQELIAHLRSPEGCPWDRKQTLASLREDLLEECMEVLEAIDYDLNGDTDNGLHIAEELGDLLMSATLMVQIASEGQRFQMADAVRGIVTKLIRRHPHVFAQVEVDGIDQIYMNWDAIKAQEKAAKGEVVNSVFDGIPPRLPALEKARKLQSKASKAGLLDRKALVHEFAQSFPELAEQLSEKRLGAHLWQLVAFAYEQGWNAENALREYGVQYRASQE